MTLDLLLTALETSGYRALPCAVCRRGSVMGVHQLHAALTLLAEVRRETEGAPSLVLYDGQPYKVIPTALADQIAAVFDGD